MNIVALVEEENMKENVPQFKVGDLVDVHVKTVEGEKERIQIFNGIVIRRKGSGVRETFTVRRIVQGEGVERVFPVHSPNVTDVKVKKSHKIRRAKLYYLRDRTGKGARLKEIRTRVKKASNVKAPAKVKPKAPEKVKTKAPAKAKAKAKKKDEKEST